MSKRLKISVILCTYNPKPDYLNQVLLSLENQHYPENDWELILIDNASDVSLTERTDVTIPEGAKVYQENRLGLFHARERGIEESTGDYLIFVDDDTVLHPDYLQKVKQLFDENPEVGVWSGNIEPRFEKKLPKKWKLFLPYLAIRKVKKQITSKEHDSVTHPCGAGMCIQRDVALRYLQDKITDPIRSLLGRRGKSLLAGEDTDIGLTACDMGLATGLSPKLQVTHLISADRIELGYLKKLVEVVSYSHALLFYFRGLRKTNGEKLKNFKHMISYLSKLKRPACIVYRCVLLGKLKALEDYLKWKNEQQNPTISQSYGEPPKRSKRILVLSHGDHGGAPIVLTNICKHLHDMGYEINFIFLSKSLQKQSAIIESCKRIGDVMSINWTIPKWPNSIKKIARMIRRVFVYVWNCTLVRIKINKYQPDVIYANTTVSAKIFKLISEFDIPVVLHVHELQQFIKSHCEDYLPEITNIPERYLAVSEAVESFLSENLLVEKSKIQLAYSALDPERVPEVNRQSEKRYPDHPYIIGGAGSIERRKGVDLWLEMAAILKAHWKDSRKIKFVWCGKPIPRPVADKYYLDMQEKVKVLGLEHDVEFRGFEENPFSTYQSFDVLAMTSREDPFPLVCLEAMYLSVPVVYFSTSGGSSESVGEDAGVPIHIQNPNAMAEAVLKLLINAKKRKQMGMNGKKKVRDRFMIHELVEIVDRNLMSACATEKPVVS